MYRNLLIAAIIVSGVGYLFAMAGEQTVLRWILKPGTILLIMGLAGLTRNVSKAYKTCIIVGLFLSAIGDSLLLLPGKQWFAAGLFAFLAAHLVYIMAFITKWKFSSVHWLSLIPIAVYSYFLLRKLQEGMYTSGNSGLWMPVLIYVIVISIMIWSAVISRSRIAVAGAVLFFLSDSLLAWNMFVAPLAWAKYGVMITYYSAQFLIALSMEKKS
ncbi:lysoplasmalogenase [Paenibacillus filicis]|uniref:Lysoplasmalogenase n=1 Tax=Paenibacillus filicis TaxID=669464 RepID=A0ABU9DGC5_9BACL